jgi:tryptophan synthase alpha subunit
VQVRRYSRRPCTAHARSGFGVFGHHKGQVQSCDGIEARHSLDTGANGIVIGSKTVQKAREGQMAREDHLGEMRAVLNGS